MSLISELLRMSELGLPGPRFEQKVLKVLNLFDGKSGVP